MEEEYGRPDCPDYGYLEERREADKVGVGATLGQDVEEELCAAHGGEKGGKERRVDKRRSKLGEIRVKHT